MNKLVNQALCDIFADAFLAQKNGFSTSLAKQRDVRGGVVFERRKDRSRAAWVIFGRDEDRDRSLSLYAGWTTRGDRYVDLPLVWLGDRPIPAGGRFDALLSAQFSDLPIDFDGSSLCFEIERPSVELQSSVLERYFASTEYQARVDKTVAVVSRRKVPESRDKIEADIRLSEQCYMEQWDHVAERTAMSREVIEPYARSAIDAILEYTSSTVVPWLMRHGQID